MKPDISVTFACLNQSRYTKACLESVLQAGISADQVIVVDNASTDDTHTVLSNFPGIHVIVNRTNLGCGVAWNQGALLQQAEWTIVMNNDIVVVPGWAEELVRSAERHDLQLVSPAMVEGSDDYDLRAAGFQRAEQARMTLRVGHVHAVCMLVHASIWQKVGYFRASPHLLGYEDTLFFNECRARGIRMGTVGSSWIHHYGSITQNAMRLERGLSSRDGLGDRHNYRLLGKNRVVRKWEKFRLRQSIRQYQTQEIATLGFSLHGQKALAEKIRWDVY